MGALEHGGLHPDGFQGGILFPQLHPQLLCLTVKSVQIVMGLLQDEGSRRIVLFRFFCGSGELIQGIQPYGYLYSLQLLLHFQIPLGLFRLKLQRFQLQLQLGDLIADAQQIVFRALQLALCLLFPVAVFGDTGSLFKDLPAVPAFQGKDLIDAALTDIGVALPAQAGVHQELIDIFQAGRLAVDIVFAVAGAVVAPGDDHLIGIVGQSPVRIVQRQRCLRKAQLRALGRSAKDHILHFGTPEGLGALFAHDPQDRVGNIGFSGTVGTYDGGDIIAEPDHRFVRKGLEALQFQ